eukprot:TRINITY_DN10206_c0_g1_i2.p1 TRINITY_DN10206_c0_g1~~TRINITY_DN10206_c0_g1_i2.p1  ORF type:complete len:219 (+),score=48.60 TRINITY_DN10206_c0_g1_i2:63-659(+)
MCIRDRICPGGKASMKLVKATNSSANQSQVYRGIDIRVSFAENALMEEEDDEDEHHGRGDRRSTSSRGVEQSAEKGRGRDTRKTGTGGLLSIAKLSHGQKTVIAVALILALQKCDPSPFYLFDEFDAALDSNYRVNIRRILEEQAQSAQYLITTFKSDMIGVPDARFFQINYADRKSRIRAITYAEADDIISRDAVHI